MVSRVSRAARRHKLACMPIGSGAGHDARSFARAGIPTAMIFVPCRQGRSHCPQEEISRQQAADGCRVLLEVLLDLARGGTAALA